MGERPTLLIVGAGIAGLSAALAVARTGFNVVVCERATELTELGAGIQLSPNAGRVLAGLGLDNAIAEAAIEPVSIDIRNGTSGTLLASLPVREFRHRYGFPYRVIHRADLQSILVNAVRQTHGVSLILGATVADVLHRDDLYFVKLKGDRGEVITALGIVGADGVRSATRHRIDGARSPTPTGRTAWRTMIPLDNAPTSLPVGGVGLWLGPGAHLVHYPTAGGAAVNVVAIVEEDWDKPGWNTPGDYRWIAERFNTWTADVRAIVTAPTGWQKWAINTVDPEGPWSQEATTLIGDAAHAMVPFLAQGAAMAIEDAADLADCLSTHPGNVASAFAAYEAVRRPRVTRLWNAAKRAGERYHATGTTALLRNLALRAVGTRLTMTQNDWIYRWRPGPTIGDTTPTDAGRL
ncbi:MAG: NAD(P)-binding protein [Hyphomicrobiales bacterium]|nr:NAD(P)-binding protein [Hyphomicrobiales bacterium]